jgi:hypothetical protein
MRTQFCHAAVALALVAGAGAANAQTVITREITTEPVETIIERGPTGTVITRRPLGTVPRSSVTDTVVSEPVETITRSRETVGSVTRFEPDDVETRRVAPPPRAAAPRRTVKAKAQTRRAAEPVRAPTRAVSTVRTTTGIAPAETVVALSPAQRSMIYRTILEERVVPRTTVVTRPLLPPPFGAPFAPATREVVTEPVITRPSAGVVVDPIETEGVVTRRVVPAPREVVVGARVPATVPLYALPETVVRQVPVTRSYQYAVVDDRVFLVDPETSLITAELND